MKRSIIVFAFIVVSSAAASTAVAQDPTPSPSPTPAVLPTPSAVATPPLPNAQLPSEPPPIAPNFEAPLRPLPSAERVGVDLANQFPLTLEEAITLALRNNNDIDTSRNDVQIAEFNLKGARGIYDPIISSESYYESTTIPTASLIGGAVNGAVTQTRYFGNAGVSGFTPWLGGNYSARFDSTRSTTSNTNSFLNPQFPTVLNFSYTQPLLRGLKIDNNRRLIEIAKKNLSLSDSEFRQRAIEVIAQVEQAYWNLAFALRNLQVQIDAVKQARTQLESNQRQVAKGALAPIDVVAATGQIATFEQAVYAAQEIVTRAENTLKTLLLADRNSPEWARAITPVSPISLEPPRVSFDLAISEALKNRQEITQLQTNAEINKINEEYFRDQTKPQIDLIGSYTSQGLAGSVTANGTGRVPDNLIGGYFSSLGNLIAQDYPTYRVGVSISLPWGNRTAKANLGRTLVEGTRIENQRAQTEQVIESEVRNALQAVRSAEALLASAVTSRIAEEQLEASEQRQFAAGTTTTYLVLERQNNLRAARSRELLAQTALNRAISELQRATGTTLTANNVTISTTGERDLRMIRGTSRFFK